MANRKIVVLIICLCISRILLSQEQNAEPVHRYIGIGIRSSIFQISELPTKTVPPNKIFLNVDPIKYLRLEGHFGMYENSRQEIFNSYPNGNITVPLKEGSTLLGGGIFGVYPKDNIKFIAGLRLSQNKYKQDNVNSSGGSIPYAVADNGEINITAIILGGEYCFNKWFSIGAEFGLLSMKDTFHPWDQNIPSTTATTTVTESSIVFRFYPY